MRASVDAPSGSVDSGLTTALVSLALEKAQRGTVLVVCSHRSSLSAFRAVSAARDATAAIVADTLCGHLARFMRADFASSGVLPGFVVGTPAAGIGIVRQAAEGMLDLTWPELRDGSVSIDVPYARRMDTLVEEAAELIQWLRRNRVSQASFAAACASGVREFYGEDIEAARVRLADPETSRRASRRAREALRATEDVLREQRRAERDLGVLLARLYAEYVAVERRSPVKTEADVIDGALSWFSADAAAVRRAFQGCVALVVDDAEDAEPALPEMLDAARGAGVGDVVVAGRDASAIDHLDGRRPCVAVGEAAWDRLEYSRAVSPRPQARRFADESSEADWIAETIGDLLRGGVKPDDIAVLGRDDDAALIYAGLLSERGVPIVPPSSRFADPAGVADLLALAHVCDDPLDQARLLRVLASPLAGLSDASLWALCRDPAPERQLALDMDEVQSVRGGSRRPGATRLAENVLSGAADGSLPDQSREVVRGLRLRLAEWRRACARLSPPDAVRFLAADAGFERHWRLAPAYLAPRLADDAARLFAALDAAWRSGAARGLREAVALLEDGVLAAECAGKAAGAVSCEGVVAVKGLRFPHVFVAGVARERFPRVYVPRALAYSKTFGLVVRENVAGGSSRTAKFAWYYAKFDAKRRYLEGERRVLAYAASRGILSSSVTGFGTAPYWAAGEDLLAKYLHESS